MGVLNLKGMGLYHDISHRYQFHIIPLYFIVFHLYPISLMGKIVPPVYAHESIFCGPRSRISAQHPASEGERALNHGASGTEFFGDVLLFLGSFLGDKMGNCRQVPLYIYILYNIIHIYIYTYVNDEYVYDMYMYIYI